MVVRVSVLETGISLMELDYEARGAQIVSIRRTTATGPTGINRCDIATNAVHDDTDISVRDTVYVGLYPTDGKLLFYTEPLVETQ